MKRRSRSAALGVLIGVTGLVALSGCSAHVDNVEDSSIRDEIEAFQKAGFSLKIVLDPDTGEPISYEIRE